jgi:hypothetical protein
MMLGWTFAVRMIDELARLLRAMGKHRYIKEVDLKIHWAVDEALRDLPEFDMHRQHFREFIVTPDLALGSRDPRLWREATVEEIIAVFTSFWSASDEAIERRHRLVAALQGENIPIAEHTPFESDPEIPPFPELLLCDWTLLPVEDLDTETHKGVLMALEDSNEEVNPSEPLCMELPAISVVELCDGAPLGVLEEDLVLGAELPFAYADYVFRGVSRAAKLEEPPVGPYEEDEEEEHEFS